MNGLKLGVHNYMINLVFCILPLIDNKKHVTLERRLVARADGDHQHTTCYESISNRKKKQVSFVVDNGFVASHMLVVPSCPWLVVLLSSE